MVVVIYFVFFRVRIRLKIFGDSFGDWYIVLMNFKIVSIILICVVLVLKKEERG